MKVAFYLADQNPHRDRTRGITVYTDGLLRALSADADLHLSALISRSSYSPSLPQLKLMRIPFRTDRSLTRLLADQAHPLLFRKGHDLWHYPKGYLPLALRYRQPILGTCHDVILQHYADQYPEFRSASEYSYWLRVLRSSLSRFDVVFTVSEFSKSQIIQFCERYRIRTPKIVLTVEGTDWENAPELPVPKEDFVLHLGSLEPHKGTSRLLNHWKLLEAMERQGPNLMIIGDVSPENLRLIAGLKKVEHRPPQSRGTLNELMQKARALIFPSEIEGFGLPAIEAFAAHTPVVFGRDTAVAEIAGSEAAGAYILDDFESFHIALNAALNLSPQHIRQIRDRLALKYTWKACAETTFHTYKQYSRDSVT